MKHSVLDSPAVAANGIDASAAVPANMILDLEDDSYVVIEAYDRIPPFFCSLTSDADIWVFISSTGSLTAGRKDPDSSILPYETVDRIHDSGAHTGPVAILRWRENGGWRVWEPFCGEGKADGNVRRRLMKNVAGTRMVFEETLVDEGLSFSSTLMISGRFGLVRECRVRNSGDKGRCLEVLHGMRNLVASGITRQLQNEMSCLTDAYKQNEILEPEGLGVFSMASGVTDHPVPYEVLRATVAWSCGLPGGSRSVDPSAPDQFRAGKSPAVSAASRGVRAHWFEWAEISVPAAEDVRWKQIADTGLSQGAVARIQRLMKTGLPVRDVEEDVLQGEDSLRRRLAAADGYQETADNLATAHHLANVLFNVMRGGTFPGGYEMARDDFRAFLVSSNRALAAKHEDWLKGLPERVHRDTLLQGVKEQGCVQLERVFFEYLPLSFSRRHGDPSRPWNRFRIETRDEEGRDILTFQGNWRDIFQNWEALALSFPAYLESMISKFVNASSVDGYNPYRIMRDGIDWEEPEPENPWAAFGYWGDHQIIYLLKLLEAYSAHNDGALPGLLNTRRFTYANVPYRIKPFEEILQDSRNTLECDTELAARLRKDAATRGSDEKLVTGVDGMPALVSFMEKLLVPLLAKWSNFLPGGGIWMNTQRPEWNDGNNALVGNGLSMVTLCYLRRHHSFLLGLLEQLPEAAFAVSAPVAEWMRAVHCALADGNPAADCGDAVRRFAILRALGTAASAHREAVYGRDFTEDAAEISAGELTGLLQTFQAWTDETIRRNKRADGLYHAYNLMLITDEGADIGNLDPMLEGQVAALSAGLLSAGEAIELLDSLRVSPLYCPRRRSYILYPDRAIIPFLRKNRLDAQALRASPLLAAMMKRGDHRIVYPESDTVWRFHPDFTNEGDLRARLDVVEREGAYGKVGPEDRRCIHDLYEGVFNHHSFTGRSGSMFAYEGLGSIYWHMVSKLLLATQEVLVDACKQGAPISVYEGLDRHYEAIRDGLGFRKSAEDYGAFPTDPYSHTPAHAGAQQPGMTGQVKEEILTRRGELGVRVERGSIHFAPVHRLLGEEFLPGDGGVFRFIDATGLRASLPLRADSLAFTLCQTPVVYRRTDAATGPSIRVHSADGREERIEGDKLGTSWSQSVFRRDGSVRLIEVELPAGHL
ncbi:MAG: hypothetical protein JJU00_00645 [Opitutales bacterium]|nr:hypothetical protein [Opitutales bacterium]